MIAEVTAALVDTFSDAAICGSDGSRMLVASVPVAASAGQHRDLQDGGGGLRTGSWRRSLTVWSAMEVPFFV